ncbi:diguanylate cyclase domain-containing protein [Niveibacterium sp.]|uniref:diguanylate cyclase domain-containing protein n=1 Tax=Niveibacterium sp. TaxID=2017444 RepID=UPI0035AD781F
MPTTQQLLEVIRIQSDIASLGADLSRVMTHVVEQVLPLLHAEGAAIEFAEGDEMVYRAVSGVAKSSLGLRLRRAQSLSGLCVAVGQTLRADDTEVDPRVDRNACRRLGIRSMLVMPLHHQETTVGVLKVMSAQAGRFTDDDATVLELLSRLIASAMFFASQYDVQDLFYKATHDAMTGLANRALFMDRLHATLASTHRSGQAAGILMVDMDGLKAINDSLGHRAGDAAIIEFARRLQAGARRTDTVARLGGDEFAVILSPIDTRMGAQTTMQRIDADLAAPFLFDDRVLSLRASVGVALVPEDGCDAEHLIDVADSRMYAMKRERKDPPRTQLQ